MTEAERIWSEKTEIELIEAAADLDQFTEDGQRIIRAELKRRGLEDPVEQAAVEPGAGSTADEAAEPECLRCHVQLHPVDPDDPDEATRWSVLGEMRAGLLGRIGLDVYVCPRCGHVDLFADLPDEDEAPEDPDDDQAAPAGGGGWAPG